MDVRSITTLKTILSEGSFQKAARRLNYTQSTITFQVRQLEHELGLTLFEKIGRRMVLTQEGKAILPHVESILESMGEIAAFARGREELRGDLKVALAESILSYKIQPVLKAFIRQAPGVRLSLSSLNCHDIKDALMTGEADVGVYYDVGGHAGTLQVHRLGSFRPALVASPQLAKDERDFVTPGQDKACNLVINEKRSIYREHIEGLFKRHRITVAGTVELWSIEAIKMSVASNLGISYLPRFCVERELRDGTLLELESPPPVPEVTAVCVHHKNKRLTPAMELFIGLVRGSEGLN